MLRQQLLRAAASLHPLSRISCLQTSTPALSPAIQWSASRFYAAKKKDSKPSKASKSDDSSAPPAEFDMTKTKAKMQACIDRLKQNLSTSITIGRANPALLDKVLVTNEKKGGHGSGVPLSQLAQISAKDAQTLMVVLNDEDFTAIAEKGIRDANLGFSPLKVDASTIKVTVPKMSAEYRETILKSISQIAEKHKTQIRELRGAARTDVKKLKIKSTDEVRRIETKIQVEHDAFIKEVDAAADAKKKEVSAH
ncbi:hypothetical protein CcCBS67573_g09007 [Chytriomyces confervae]|uniref:Ribosome recycling factor domain-containing protein n=1 Tax=Chytriomyces confervae TaxID=246404 RepID=A0A507E8X2_9FUNG|nr:hypothetical protein HDU80_010502 [Chytriomyces hyalinus]TPX60352.1 hypothetical protein CcCBS67573_g09007 [Chytriomyces confervae]